MALRKTMHGVDINVGVCVWIFENAEFIVDFVVKDVWRMSDFPPDWESL